MNLILIRHGETLFNRMNLVQGWCDSPLTDKGIEQAKIASKLIENEYIDQAYSSTSERAYDTAVIAIGNRNLTVKEDKRLKEMNFGIFEGSNNNYKDHYYKNIQKGDIEDFTFYRGENETIMLERFNSCINELYSKYPDQTILIASHGLVLTRFIQQHCKDEIAERFPEFHFCFNAHVTKMIIDDTGYHLEYLNKGEE